jgi:hypothetical protein
MWWNGAIVGHAGSNKMPLEPSKFLNSWRNFVSFSATFKIHLLALFISRKIVIFSNYLQISSPPRFLDVQNF